MANESVDGHWRMVKKGKRKFVKNYRRKKRKAYNPRAPTKKKTTIKLKSTLHRDAQGRLLPKRKVIRIA